MIRTPDQRTYRFGAFGFAAVSVLALIGYALLVWGVWALDWLPPLRVFTGGIGAAMVLLGGGVAMGRAITSGRPRAERLFTAWAGAACGAVGLLFGVIFYLMVSTG